MESQAESIDSLLDRWRSGEDREAVFYQIFRRYFARLHRFFEKRGFSVEESEELTLETFFCIYKGLEGFRREARFETWVYKIAFSVCRQFLRQRKSQKSGGHVISMEQLHDPDGRMVSNPGADLGRPSVGPLDQLLAQERLKVLSDAVQELPVQMRRCLTLRILHELEYTEIAAVMRLSVETVRSHLRQARQRMKHAEDLYLGHEEDEKPKEIA